MKVDPTPLKCPCEARHFCTVFAYHVPPECEIKFEFSSSEDYRRDVLQCKLCGHFVSVHKMHAEALYSEGYVDANYSDQEGIHRTFERILSLSPSLSDNTGRVQRILAFAQTHFAGIDRPLSVLDVGSGLGVFPYKMKEAGWDCTALDPDIRSVKHAREVVEVNAVHGDFMDVIDLEQFDLVTFNKVLEHVQDPVTMLTKSADHVGEGGLVYVEVPDGEKAVLDGPGREEFTIDHLHVFSSASLDLLATRAGFSVSTLERLQEPSGKYTLWAFLKLDK